jgi:hypothetical protein
LPPRLAARPLIAVAEQHSDDQTFVEAISAPWDEE